MANYRIQHRYKNSKYFHMLRAYAQSEDYNEVVNELKFLSRDNNIPDDSDAFYFINDALAIANKLGHNKVITKCRELGNQIKKTTGSAGAYTSIVEDALETESDCVKAFNECFEDGRYESVLSGIVECVKRNKDFHIAVTVLKKICETNIVSVTASKNEVALYFIDRVDIVLENDICVKNEGGLFGKFFSEKWKKFSHKDYKEYLSLRAQFKKSKIYLSENTEKDEVSTFEKLVSSERIKASVESSYMLPKFSITKVEVTKETKNTYKYSIFWDAMPAKVNGEYVSVYSVKVSGSHQRQNEGAVKQVGGKAKGCINLIATEMKVADIEIKLYEHDSYGHCRIERVRYSFLEKKFID